MVKINSIVLVVLFIFLSIDSVKTLDCNSAGSDVKGISECYGLSRKEEVDGKGITYSKCCYMYYQQKGITHRQCIGLLDHEYQDIEQAIDFLENTESDIYKRIDTSSVRSIFILDCSAKYLTLAALAIILFIF